jgi:hypothetical protein
MHVHGVWAARNVLARYLDADPVSPGQHVGARHAADTANGEQWNERQCPNQTTKSDRTKENGKGLGFELATHVVIMPNQTPPSPLPRQKKKLGRSRTRYLYVPSSLSLTAIFTLLTLSPVSLSIRAMVG